MKGENGMAYRNTACASSNSARRGSAACGSLLRCAYLLLGGMARHHALFLSRTVRSRAAACLLPHFARPAACSTYRLACLPRQWRASACFMKSRTCVGFLSPPRTLCSLACLPCAPLPAPASRGICHRTPCASNARHRGRTCGRRRA